MIIGWFARVPDGIVHVIDVEETHRVASQAEKPTRIRLETSTNPPDTVKKAKDRYTCAPELVVADCIATASIDQVSVMLPSIVPAVKTTLRLAPEPEAERACIDESETQMLDSL